MTNEAMNNEDAKIGKDVIESLTIGMYEDNRFIYREYIQNAADSIDKAVAQGLLKKEDGEIHVLIDKENRTIRVEDNATGISQEKVVPVLRNIARSTKKRGEDKGFRGIGRLGGLGYCSKLTFETSYCGEPVKSVMTWDADLLKAIINDRKDEAEAKDVLVKVTKVTTEKEDADKHYFHVIMEGVTLDDLLDEGRVEDYLSMVSPVEISSSTFIFKKKIDDFIRDNGLSVDTYNIYVNGVQIYKPYTNQIYEDNNGGKKKVDEVKDVNFITAKDDEGNLIYWGWYSISMFIGQMKPINKARGIRLRKENIQIGDEEICKKFFDKTSDQRFSFYYFGEIHAVSKDLIPNSRRDYFGENKSCVEFEKKLKNDFIKLKEFCYAVSGLRGEIKTIEKANEVIQKKEEKDKNGYLSKTEEETLIREFETWKNKSDKAQKQLEAKKQRIKDSGSPLAGFIDSFLPKTKVAEEHIPEKPSISQVQKPRFRTDSPAYSMYNKQERKLIGKIYAAIANAIADEVMREALIRKIEDDITQ